MGLWAARYWFAELDDVGCITLCDLESLSGEARSTMADAPATVVYARAEYASAGLTLVDHETVRSIDNAALQRPELKNMDLVVLATPLSVTDVVMNSLQNSLSAGTWLIDMASVKSAPLQQMIEKSNPDISIVGTHPLFGITGDSISGQTVVLVPTCRDSNSLVEWLDHGLTQLGAKTLNVTAKKHDRYMLIAQTLTHFALMAFGQAVTKSLETDESLEELRTFGTPPYLSMGNMTGRLLSQNHQLYAAIQQVDGADLIRASFAKAAQQLAESFDSGSLKDIEVHIGELAESYGVKELEDSARLSEKMFLPNQADDPDTGI